jgi:beta-lactamase class D
MAAPARADTVCTLVTDGATGRVVHEQGDCDGRATPASTFKIALALMGYDAGILDDAHAPVLPFKEGYPDWIAAWRQPIDPTAWLKHSVVWYSQRVAEALGEERFGDYLTRFDYGNADGSGDPGRDNALERSWISSSLTISPREQVRFISRLVGGNLPVSREAITETVSIVEQFAPTDGWQLWGKTGSAYPRRADGSFDRDRPWGWFVGWATRDGRLLVFARLNQDTRRTEGSSGVRARDGLLADWPGLAASASD